VPSGGLCDAPKLGQVMAVKTFGFEEAKNRARSGGGGTLSEAALRELALIAEEACNKARDTYPTRASGGYDDQTRNLRGSIGYSIRVNGKEVTRGGFDGRGSADGKKAAEAGLDLFGTRGAMAEIVIVAGMEYARYVEAKGHNVITFVQPWLEEQMEKLGKDIKAGRI
jgi:hypothetical protein